MAERLWGFVSFGTRRGVLLPDYSGFFLRTYFAGSCFHPRSVLTWRTPVADGAEVGFYRPG
jgi:hypothetical protein